RGTDCQFMREYCRANGDFTAGIGKIARGAFPDSIKWDVFAEPQRGGDDEGRPAAKAGKRKAKQQAAGEPVPFAWQATGNRDEGEPDGKVARKVVKLLEENKDK